MSGAGGGVGSRRFACTPREASETGGKCALFEHDVFGQPGAVRRASSRTPVSENSRGESRPRLDSARLAGTRPNPRRRPMTLTITINGMIRPTVHYHLDHHAVIVPAKRR